MDAYHRQYLFALTPSACRECGVPERGHYQRWRAGIGWHSWTVPTERQIKNRMQIRRRILGAYRWR